MSNCRSDAAGAVRAGQPTESLASQRRPTIIGLYGVSGCGKTYQLRQLEKFLPLDSVTLYDGSNIINRCTPGGLEAFKTMTEEAQLHWREAAIKTIHDESLQSDKAALVAGHHMLWSGEEGGPQVVCTSKDWETYTHIIYMETPAELVSWRRQNDAVKMRPALSIEQIRFWQRKEKESLRFLCRHHKVLFISIPASEEKFALLTLATQWLNQSEFQNLFKARERLDKIVTPRTNHLETILVFDADKTLAAQDSGELFFQNLYELNGEDALVSPLKNLFAGPFGYSFDAFCQATLLYEETVPSDAKFEALCGMVSAAVTMYPQIVTFLKQAAKLDHVGIIVMTCGLGLVWEKVLDRFGLSQNVSVIGGGRLKDGIVVTPSVKGALVTHLRQVHNKRICAFGDSPLDLPMLKAADVATVVVGDLKTRSKSMEDALKKAIEEQGLQARQLLLPETASMRLNASILPPTTLRSAKFLNLLLARKDQQVGLTVLHATDSAAAKLLATPTRNAKVHGSALRRAHHNVGWHLAVNFLCDAIGLEEFDVQHTLGNLTKGHGLRAESTTLIVALMRGGEPMAFGVNEVFPRASFLHASRLQDVTPALLSGVSTVILVDSVINSGRSMVEFVRHIRQMDAAIRIFMVAGVAQSKAVAPGGPIDRIAGKDGNLCLVALRLSDNQYTGKGGTDTGNRLFNTTHID